VSSGPQGPGAGQEAYREAGVDLEAASAAIEAIRDLAGEAGRPEVVRGVGGFAGLVDLGDGRVLSASTDGVGTKLEVARRAGRLDTVGIDLVAMCANDVVCTGARPLFFLDYVAVGNVVPSRVAALVAGVAEGCRRAGCALLGGETAEHPGTMPEDGFDLAGFCVGIANRGELLDPSRVEPGDALLGFPSTGLHANGFSLVRRVLLEGAAARPLDELVPVLGRTLADELLEPTAIYAQPVLALAAEGLARSAAHITGGGFGENVPRALPEGLAAWIDPSTWHRAPIFDLVAGAAGLEARDLFDVLNMGIGMVVVVPADRAVHARSVASDAGVEAVQIGEVIQAESGTGTASRVSIGFARSG
jgi:phosphoribosylformylglycinamidine cyclo-ligase